MKNIDIYKDRNIGTFNIRLFNYEFFFWFLNFGICRKRGKVWIRVHTNKIFCKTLWHNLSYATTVEGGGLELFCKNCNYSLDIERQIKLTNPQRKDTKPNE